MPKSQVRYQIFVSSTYKDLLDERQAAVEAILRAGHIPAGMELFAAQNKPQMEVIREWIEESDIFCLILGARYGSIESASGKSYVECEYDHALKLGKPIFSLVLDEEWISANVSKRGHKVIIEQDNSNLLKVFRGRITSTLVRIVANLDSIKVAVFEAIAALERHHEIDGWVRARNARVSPQVGEELARLSQENARLTKELTAARAAREEQIDGRTLKEWWTVLAGYTFSDWDRVAGKVRANARVTLLSVLLRYGHILGAGVSNAANASEFHGWLFPVASTLVSLGLAETMKVPARVYWQRLGFSAAGKRLYAALMAQSSSADAATAATDSWRLLQESSASQRADETVTVQKASTETGGHPSAPQPTGTDSEASERGHAAPSAAPAKSKKRSPKKA